MTGLEELARRRKTEAKRIRALLDGGHENRMADLKIGETAVAFVKEELCIGCDQCPLVCDDDAIDMVHRPMRSPLLELESNRKAVIRRDDCTGCALCVLACPTDAIAMIDR
tara:strand:+ start:10844 stop:11176 length:333 start_codon:yes stop_codon:yes gene_type:complete